MSTSSTPFDKRRSREIGRRRVVAIRHRLVRPCDIDDLIDIVPDRKALSRILCKMRDRRQVYRFQIEIGDFTGEARYVWCLYRISSAAHDNALTKVMKALGWPEEEKPTLIKSVGSEENERDRVKPDAVTLQPKRRLWEMDMDTEREEEIRKKSKALAQQTNAVLWVCPNEVRRRRLIDWTTEIHDRSFYAVWQDLIDNPNGKVWMTARGDAVALGFVRKDVRNEEGNHVPNN